MDTNIIPEVISNYNVYDNDANALVGISGEIPLPNFEALTTTMSGAGLLGEIEDPVVGQFKSMDTEVPFRTLHTDMFELMNTGTPLSITIRGSEQSTASDTGATVQTQIRVVMKGKFKSFTGGKMKIGEGTDSKVKMELWYILIEINGKTMLELDKFNPVYIVNGKDMLAEINKFC